LYINSGFVSLNFAFTECLTLAIFAAQILGSILRQLACPKTNPKQSMRRSAMKKLFVLTVLMSGVLFNVSAIAEEFDVAAKYAQTCAVCHNSGVAGAPKKGDSAAWKARLAKGEDALHASVKNGMGAMPATGLCSDCSDDQFKALIQYMSK
jgi:cytochrome c5